MQIPVKSKTKQLTFKRAGVHADGRVYTIPIDFLFCAAGKWSYWMFSNITELLSRLFFYNPKGHDQRGAIGRHCGGSIRSLASFALPLLGQS